MIFIKTWTTKTLIASLLLVSLSGCASTTTKVSSTSSSAATDSSTVDLSDTTLFGDYSEEDLVTDWDDDAATHITLVNKEVEIDGSGATASGSIVTIKSSGTYVFEGSLSDGQIIVSANKTDTIRIILNGVEISSSTTAPIYVEQADKVIMTLAEGSENTVNDATSYVYTDDTTDEPNAAIFSKDDLTINGAGSLTVTANYNNGIASKDDLVITGGSFIITAVNHGLRGRDSISILDGTFDINAGGDGLQSNNDGDTSKGWIALDGGSFALQTGHDGIQAQTDLKVSDGAYQITAAQNSDSTKADDDDTSTSYKGLKGLATITVTGGSFNIDAEDDGVHSNGTITIEDGDFNISTGDDGIHADSQLTITGGTIIVAQSYEGLEAAQIDISGGTIHVTSSDDGINAGGGSDGSAGSFGADQFASNSGDYNLNISGGTLVIDAEGDGLDSNGTITMSGGTVLVNGPVMGGNGALDYDISFDITGGILVAAGTSDMAEAPSDSSSQAALSFFFNSSQAAGTLINVQAEDGSEIITFAPAKAFSSIVISTPNLQQGSNYNVSSGGSHSGSESDGLYSDDGSYSDGTLLTEISLSSIITIIDETGAAVSGGMMGGGGFGNGGPQ